MVQRPHAVDLLPADGHGHVEAQHGRAEEAREPVVDAREVQQHEAHEGLLLAGAAAAVLDAAPAGALRARRGHRADGGAGAVAVTVKVTVSVTVTVTVTMTVTMAVTVTDDHIPQQG